MMNDWSSAGSGQLIGYRRIIDEASVLRKLKEAGLKLIVSLINLLYFQNLRITLCSYD